MNRQLLICIFVIALSWLGCRDSHNLSEAQRATVAGGVKEMMATVSDSLKTKGPSAWLPYLQNSPEFKWEYKGVVSKYDAVVAGLQQQSLHYQSIAIVWDSVEIKPQTLDQALLSAKFSETSIKFGGEQSTYVGSLNAKIVLSPGGWKFHSGQAIGQTLIPTK